MAEKMVKILLDNGHGVETLGKRSPDGRLREYSYTREVARGVCDGLRERGYDADLLVREEHDVPLGERVKRVNAVCKSFDGHVLVVSVHCDAAGSDGLWHSARGWSGRVALNASRESKRLARCLAVSARGARLRVRTPDAKTDYWAQNLAICRDTLCPAVLTENLFMDNKEDVEFLLSEEGKAVIVGVHVEGIINYVKGL